MFCFSVMLLASCLGVRGVPYLACVYRLLMLCFALFRLRLGICRSMYFLYFPCRVGCALLRVCFGFLYVWVRWLCFCVCFLVIFFWAELVCFREACSVPVVRFPLVRVLGGSLTTVVGLHVLR